MDLRSTTLSDGDLMSRGAYRRRRPGIARRIGLLVGAVLMALTFVLHPAQADDLVAAIKNVKVGVVGVGTYQEIRRPPSKLLGTGFAVIDRRHILTNAHVLPKLIDNRRREFYCVFVGSGADVKIVPVEVVAKDELHDLAILRASTDMNVSPLTLGDDSTAMEGRSVAFTGYPIGTALGLHPVTHRGIISARTPIAIPQDSPSRLDAQIIKRLRRSFQVLQLDATAYPGNSGSPLFEVRSAKVIGIISSVFVKLSKERALSEPSGITYAIPVRHATDLIDKVKASRPQ